MKKITVGRLSKPFGQQGGLVMNLYAGFPEKPAMDQPLWVLVDALDVPLYIESFERRGRTSAVVAFADIDTPRRAAAMVGREVFMPGVEDEKTRDDDQLYLEDLVGYMAHLGGGVKGRVTDFFESEFNPLFQVEADGRQTLIPAADDFIEKVDEKRREVWFTIPDGLLTLNE